MPGEPEIELSRFSRRLLRWIPGEAQALIAASPSAHILRTPREDADGTVHRLRPRSDLTGLAIEFAPGPSPFRFGARTEVPLTLYGYSRSSSSTILVDGAPISPPAQEAEPGTTPAGWMLQIAAGHDISWETSGTESLREFILIQIDTAANERPAVAWRRFAEARLELLVDRIFEIAGTTHGNPECDALSLLAFAWMSAASPETESQQAAADSSGAMGDSTESGTLFRPALPAEELRKVRLAREILYAEYLEPPTTAQLSRRVHLNEFKLKRGYRLAFATSINADLRAYRMRLARDLFLAGERNVASVACAVGYSNPGHFARAFHQAFGVSPGKITQSNRRGGVPLSGLPSPVTKPHQCD